jgi:hypothetical protein
MDSYDGKRFWDTKKIADNASGGRYRVRWAVNRQERCKSFKNKTLADGFLDNLKDAARDRRPFSPRTGLPAAETTRGETVTWYEHARSYAEAKWAGLAPVSRRSVAEALVTVTVALTGKEKGAPEPRVLRRALFAWAFNPATRETDPPREITLALGWAARCSTTPPPATATSDLTGTPSTPTAAAKPATPDDSSRPSATTSSSPCGRTPPELGVTDNRIAFTAARAPLATGPPRHARNRDHVRRLRWLFLGQTVPPTRGCCR